MKNIGFFILVISIVSCELQPEDLGADLGCAIVNAAGAGNNGFLLQLAKLVVCIVEVGVQRQICFRLVY